jgi:hypothetical protein
MAPSEPKAAPRDFSEIYPKPVTGETAAPTLKPTAINIPESIPNPLNDPLIGAENDRQRNGLLSLQQDERRDTYGDAMDRLRALQTSIAGIRSGDPAAVSGATNPMGGYMPGQPVDPSTQARALADYLLREQEAQKQLEAARRNLLWLQSPQGN